MNCRSKGIYLGKRRSRKVLILRLLSDNANLDIISKSLKIDERSVKRQFYRLMKKGYINKDCSLTSLGYDILKTHHDALILSHDELSPETIRSHSFQFTVRIPVLKKWERRKEFMNVKEIKYRKLPQDHTESIIIDNFKVWLSNKSVVIYFPRGYSVFGDSVEDNMYQVMEVMFNIIHKVEKIFKVNLNLADGYHIKTSKQHHSLIKDFIAKYCNDKKLKIRIRDFDGEWLIIDDSFNLGEIEFDHPVRSPEDVSIFKPFLTDIREDAIKTGEITKISDLKRVVSNLANNSIQHEKTMVHLDKNFETHFKVLEGIKEAVKDLKDEVKNLKDKGSLEPLKEEKKKKERIDYAG